MDAEAGTAPGRSILAAVRTMRSILMFCSALLAASCGSPLELDDRWAEPELIDFAPSLGIDLSQMNRTASGLYWQDLVVGTGVAAAVDEHVVTINHITWLPDGTVVGNTYEDGGPSEPFPVGGGLVLPGIDEGVVGMQAGGRRKLVIRAELAYGRMGKGAIPPLSTLIYELELVSIASAN